jgi:hypothetical protein
MQMQEHRLLCVGWRFARQAQLTLLADIAPQTVLKGLIEKAPTPMPAFAGTSILREMISFAAERLMEMEVGA